MNFLTRIHHFPSVSIIFRPIHRELHNSVSGKVHRMSFIQSTAASVRSSSILEHHFCTSSAANKQWKKSSVINSGISNPGPASSFLASKILYVPERQNSDDTKEKAIAVWKKFSVEVKENLKHLKSCPVSALTLAGCGLIPFVSPAAYMTMSCLYSPQWAFNQLAFGAAALSFLGGIRWGFVMAGQKPQLEWSSLGYTVAPPIVAWIGLLMPDSVSSLVIMSGLAGSAYYETGLGGYPSWFKAIRFFFSGIAFVSIWTVFVFSFVLDDENSQRKKK